MIRFEVIGSERIVKMLGEKPAQIKAAAKSALDVWGAELASYIKADKLSGQVLNRRSGRLSASVMPLRQQSSDSVSGGARGGRGVPYAAIHEYGGLIPAHEVVARNAQALCFSVDGIKRFAKSVHIPDVQMPERSYMRSSFKEQVPRGIEMLRAAVKEAIVT